MNITCRLFGCIPDEYGYTCIRCGASHDEQWDGHLRTLWYCMTATIQDITHAARRRWPFKHCDQCGKFMFSFSDDVPLCSKECYEEWIPF